MWSANLWTRGDFLSEMFQTMMLPSTEHEANISLEFGFTRTCKGRNTSLFEICKVTIELQIRYLIDTERHMFIITTFGLIFVLVLSLADLLGELGKVKVVQLDVTSRVSGQECVSLHPLHPGQVLVIGHVQLGQLKMVMYRWVN